MMIKHAHVVSLEVLGDAFLGGAKMEFSPHSNNLIGPRGSGKTAVQEHIYFVLSDEPPTAHLAKTLRNGTITVWMSNKYGVRYRLERGLTGPTRVFDESGKLLEGVAPRDLFPIKYYRHAQIETMATDALSQLTLLDGFAREEIDEIDHEVARVKRELKGHATKHWGLVQALKEVRETAALAPVLEQKLKGLELPPGRDAAEINEAHAHKGLRERERQAVDAAHKQLKETQEKVGALAADLGRRLGAVVDEQVLTGPNREPMRALASHLAKVKGVLEHSAGTVREACEMADAAIKSDERVLVGLHTKQEAKFAEVAAKSNEEGARAAERTRLQQQLTTAMTAKKTRESTDAEKREVESRQNTLLDELSSLRERRYAIRKRTTENVSKDLGEMIRVTIAPAKEATAFIAMLGEALTKTGMKNNEVAAQIAAHLSPMELALLVRRGDAARLAERAELDVERAGKVIERLQQTEKLYEIETLDLEDMPTIGLWDGGEYRPTGDLSPGQQCTTIVCILFLDGDCPIMIDQPEDNLDGEFICETVIRNIVKVKAYRQLILATHNPNVPIVGDCERVFVHRATKKKGRVEDCGPARNVAASILKYMDGGKDPFQRRREIYGF